MPELSIVIPVYNNEDSLETLVGGIRNALEDRFSYELLLVNDGSSDRSWSILQKIAGMHYAGTNPLIAYDLKKNYGQENAKMAGLIHAQGDHIVFMDADCQHDPEDIS